MKWQLMVRGVRYTGRQHGTSGPVVLFGHGMYFDHGMFRAVARALAPRWRCICLDWPGHGDSGWRAGGWTVQDLVDDSVALLDLLQAPQAVCVGISQGGAVFTRLALQHPARVRALAVLDASPEQPAEAARSRILEASATLASGDPQRVQAVFDSVAQRMFSPATHASQPELVARARATWARHTLNGLAQALLLPLSYASIVAQLPRLRPPTLVLWGEDDTVSAPSLLAHYCHIPGASLQTVALAGHSLALEQPQAVARALVHFLDRHSIHGPL